MAMTPYPNQLAKSGDVGSFTPFQLFAGEKEVVTNHADVAPSTELKQFQVVAFNSSGQLVAHDADATDGTEVVVGVMCQAITTDTEAAPAPYYVSGFFNHEALVWDASLTTLSARKAAVVGSEIEVDSLYGGTW